MKLVGVTTGIYQGNNYAKMFFTEPIPRDKGFGEYAIADRANYNYVYYDVLPNLSTYLGHNVKVYYDRYNKISQIVLDEPLEV